MTVSSVGQRREIAQNEYADTSAQRAEGRSPAERRNVVTDADVSRAFARLDRAFDADIALFARNAKPPAANDGILYIGFNAESQKAELAALGKTGRVRALVETSGPDDVFINGTRYNFHEPGQLEAFVGSLKLDPRTGAAVEAALRAAEPGSREKLAQIATVFAEAESGKPIPSRLVISGHSGGLDVYGGRGSLALSDLQRLARAMPRAAACIEDVHLSACASSGQAGTDDQRGAWQAAFPKLKTMWAYAGTSSMAPAAHLEAWGRATKGPHDSLEVPEHIAGRRVATWSKTDGYRDRIPVAQLRTAQVKADRRFGDFLSGTLSARTTTGRNTDPPADPQSALADYQTYRLLSQKNDVPPSERAVFARKADQLLRIRYYEEGVRSEFAKRHGPAVAAGFRALGLEPPSFDTLSRLRALETIGEFETKLASVRPLPEAAAALAPILRGLRELDRKVIPETDCHH